MPMWVVRPALTRGEVRAVRITAAGIHRSWTAATLKDAVEPAFMTDFVTLTRKAIAKRDR